MVASHPWGEKMGLFLHATAQAPLPREKQPCEEGLEDTEVTSLILFYRPFCLRVAYFTVQDADAAEDVVQDVSVKVWHTFKRYPPDQRATLRVQAWLWRVVTNEARKYLARWQKWGPYEHDAGQNVDDLEGPARDQPEQAVEAEEEKGSLQQWYWWRNRSPPQATSFMKRAKCESGVACGEIPARWSCNRQTFIAVAVMTC